VRNYQPRPRCGARKDDGTTCRNGAGANTDHPGAGSCSYHSGATSSGREHARRVQAEATAEAWGLPILTSADDALMDELARTYGRVMALAARVQTLTEDSLDTSPWPRLEQWERKHLVDLGARMVALDVDARRVRILERVGAQLADGLDTALAGAGIGAGQRARVLELLPRALNATQPGPS
jgi:hypothetical protein